MKGLLTLLLLATLLNANNNIKVLKCQIKAREVGNEIDRAGIALINKDKNEMLIELSTSINLIDSYIKQCRTVDNYIVKKIGISGMKDMQKWRVDLVNAYNKAKGIK